MFHFTGSASTRLCIQRGMGGRAATGCPIRTSPGQRLLSTSPELFAAGHVLLRLCAPRHPPSALQSLTTVETSKPELELPVLIPTSVYDGDTITLPQNAYVFRHDALRLHSSFSSIVKELSRQGLDGASRVRTDDLRLAKPALSQLSYSPKACPSKQF